MTTTARRQPAVPNTVLAMLIFLFTEVMLFAGLISSYVVLRGQAGPWPPFDQPRLPALATALNTTLLLASAPTIWGSVQAAMKDDQAKLIRRLAVTFTLGAVFLVLQGTEWVKLVRYGLTSSSSLYGSLFYTLVGCHALHVLAALFALAWVLHAARSGRYGSDNLDALLGMRLYWVFVVAVWPLLYALVYLW